jgi:very-short-patch-repair endonuclease
MSSKGKTWKWKKEDRDNLSQLMSELYQNGTLKNHNTGKTKQTYVPLKIVSEKLKGIPKTEKSKELNRLSAKKRMQLDKYIVAARLGGVNSILSQKKKITDIEMALNIILSSCDIQYNVQFPMLGMTCVDNIVCSQKKTICIYADGCRYHGCRTCGFVNKKKEMRDLRITTELQRHGYTVLRFWGHDILKNPGIVRQKILDCFV